MRGRMVAVAINLALRAIVVGVVVDALRRPNAPRYAGKAIGPRGSVLIPASAAVPAIHLLGGRRRAYPVWTDNLYLSISALDMAGNVLDLYDRHFWFDLIPHAHGTGAFTVAAAELLRAPMWAAIGIAQTGHILLEAQEYYSDRAFGLRNVRGTWDTVNDLLAGVVGSLAYGAIHVALRRRTSWLRRAG